MDDQSSSNPLTNQVSSTTPSVQPTNSQHIVDVFRPVSVNPIKAKVPLKSRTLMRGAVSKPIEINANKPAVAQVSAPADNQIADPTVIPKRSISSVDEQRQARAEASTKSQLVSRFNPLQQLVEKPAEANVQAEQSPPVPPQPPQLYQPIDPSKLVSSEGPKNIFEESLAKATAGQQQPLPASSSKKDKKFYHSLTSSAVLAVSVLMIGGLLAYQNYNKIDLYIASKKAGFHASIPNYNPSGYDLSSIITGTGVLQASYHSNSDSRNYTISERRSNWDASDLLNNYVLENAGQNYITSQTNGKTIYIYGSKNATWVNGGVWYIISSNNSLSDQQLIELASSS